MLFHKVKFELLKAFHICFEMATTTKGLSALQVKSWIRTTFSWVAKNNIERYLDEFSYRINRSQSKQKIFHNLIKRMVNKDKLYIQNIKLIYAVTSVD